MTPELRQEAIKKGLEKRKATLERKRAEKEEAKKRQAYLYEQLSELERKIEETRRLDAFCSVANDLGLKGFMRESEIVEAASKWENVCGVYFLVKGGKVVYVGQSVSVYSRIASHGSKDFDSVAFVHCPREQLDLLESLYIHFLAPDQNGNHPCGGKQAPIPLNKLLQNLG